MSAAHFDSHGLADGSFHLVISLQQAYQDFIGEDIHTAKYFIKWNVGLAMGMDNGFDQSVAKEQEGLRGLHITQITTMSA
jgi:hypothetical protein